MKKEREKNPGDFSRSLWALVPPFFDPELEGSEDFRVWMCSAREVRGSALCRLQARKGEGEKNGKLTICSVVL